MRARLLDQGDFGFAAAAKLVAKPGGKLESAGAAADDDNAMRAGCRVRPAGVAASHWLSHRSLLRCGWDWSMIPKSGHRFSEKIMRKRKS
jgi:hypothetical protein